MNGIFDSHAHYDNERFDEDRDEVLASLSQNGVCNIINVGCDKASSLASVALAEKYPFCYAAVGYHPHEAAEAKSGYLDELAELTKAKKVIAIGEIGLDYHYDFSPRDIQRRVFEEQLILANTLSLPVIIHAREASADYLDSLERYKPRGVVHCFAGSAETAKKVISMGLYIGFTGVVTFKNARKTLEAVLQTPLDRLLIETDCPYMAPEPFRGQRCRSDMLDKTAEAIANVKGISTQEVIDIARENTKRLFAI